MEELECPEHVENPINRKITIFYIETISSFFFNSEKKIVSKKNENILFFKKIKIFMILGQNQWKTKEINGVPLFFMDFDKKSWKIVIF